MKKQLDAIGIVNELRGQSAFFPKKGATEPSQEQPQNTRSLPERANVSTPQRPNGRRIITRNSFEIYEDQMDALRREAYEEKLQGGTGSMSKMVREAIDAFLEKRK